ncbi:hypothetical protein B0H11DRAFT_2245633 [Mycena galericulata]|nr:hypothetical protein B0H11DRAFT_2245633 [Mycena galericulata]
MVPQCALGCARQAATLVGCAILDTQHEHSMSLQNNLHIERATMRPHDVVLCCGADGGGEYSGGDVCWVELRLCIEFRQLAPSGTLSSSASTTATIPFSVPGSASSTILTSVSASPPISTTFNSASSSPSSLTPPPSTSTNPPTSSASSPSSVTKNGAAGLNSANMAHAVAAGVMIGIGVFLF